MGPWKINAWQKDAVSDWYGRLFEETRFAQQVAKTLMLALAEDSEDVQVAAKLAIQLNEQEICPKGVARFLVTFTALKLEQLRSEQQLSNHETIMAVDADIQQLVTVLNDMSDQQGNVVCIKPDEQSFER